MKRLISGILLVSFTISCGPVKPYRVTNFFRSSKIEERGIKRIAVLPFGNLTDFRTADLIVTDEMNLQLGKLGVFDLVERIKIEELFKEQDLDTLRFDPVTVARIGKMLGAQGVVLGNVTHFKPHPKEVIDTVRKFGGRERYPPVIIIGDHDRNGDDDFWKVACIVGAAVTVVGVVIYLIFKPKPSAEVGVSMRLVDVETGEQLWQVKDLFKGNKRAIQELVKTKEDKKRLTEDVEFLTRILCQEMVRTFKYRQ
ncbi:MAG: CsgG/HfaB family protein [candidate division WOR-3 bacterium]